jgi:GH24 family phage-related lysozyme (muramidase)
LESIYAKPAWFVQTVSDLQRHEGFREFAYPDPLSPIGRKFPQGKPWGFAPGDALLAKYGFSERDGRPWTCGFGDTVGVTPATRWPLPYATRRLEQQLIDHVKGLDMLMPDWHKHPLPVQTVLANMIYNLGLKRLSMFRPTLNVIDSGNYAGAATRLRATPWFRQTGSRGIELCNRLQFDRIEPEHLVVREA